MCYFVDCSRVTLWTGHCSFLFPGKWMWSLMQMLWPAVLCCHSGDLSDICSMHDVCCPQSERARCQRCQKWTQHDRHLRKEHKRHLKEIWSFFTNFWSVDYILHVFFCNSQYFFVWFTWHLKAGSHQESVWCELLCFFKGIVHLKMKIYWTFCEILNISEQICRNLALHHLLINGSSAVNGCRQNEGPDSW